MTLAILDARSGPLSVLQFGENTAEALRQANRAAAWAEGALPSVTTFNEDGTISAVIDGSQTSTTTFNPDGSISAVWGAPLSRTITTTFSGNTITEVQS